MFKCAWVGTQIHAHAAVSLTLLLLSLACLLLFCLLRVQIISVFHRLRVVDAEYSGTELVCFKSFRFSLIGLALVFRGPEVPNRISVFSFSSLVFSHHVCGSCCLLVYHRRYKYAHLLPCLIITQSWVHTHTHLRTHWDPKHLPWRVSQNRYRVIFPPTLATRQMRANASKSLAAPN